MAMRTITTTGMADLTTLWSRTPLPSLSAIRHLTQETGITRSKTLEIPPSQAPTSDGMLDNLVSHCNSRDTTTNMAATTTTTTTTTTLLQESFNLEKTNS
ncbi:Hypothetical predicted protein [Octopus vulgaris]|uniref:Uncharacterized protein n=1 Tax=Octopus vulgaris TaxID=6645 RepID=A0AA36FJ52_OCTVU|nr:Hypothetical predicted protein [Octopus vulgaris]